MPISIVHMRDILMPYLRMTSEEREACKAESLKIMAQKANEERAKYDAMSPYERAQYDALTEGMMPRLAGRKIGRNIMPGSHF